MERYEDVVDKVKEIQKKVKGLEDRYETNFKSLWNVLSMTEAVVFDHIKENKQSKAQINRK
jgi:RNAse (barnase) inhibitor barstar